MNILVCVKQVPDMAGRFSPNAAGTWYDEAALVFRMNERDENAVEEAVRFKEQLGGTPEVTVLSIGPGRVVETIRKALAMGCDRGVHIDDPLASERDPWQIASMIAGHARGCRYDIIFTGMQSDDRGSAQVGVLTAEMLCVSCVTGVVGFGWQDGAATADRELEGGRRGMTRLKPPMLLTCQQGLNSPRYPTLPNIMKSRKKEISVLLPDEVGLGEPLSSVTGFRHHERQTAGLFLEGDVDDLAGRVATLLDAKRGIFRRGGAV
ncbi:MAG: electron transfer flavoprotein subunit beta/FixA family protein [Chlorobiaceae bacterium]|nr:electron transfer flavoprotein subunit beta/FixA family protein [Chlorobiaceae bacterium]